MLMVPFFRTFLWELANDLITQIDADRWKGLFIEESLILKSIINSPYIDTMNKHFIGWPCVEELGGYSIKDKLNPSRSLDFQIAENDSHPNGKGQEMIANYIYDRL